MAQLEYLASLTPGVSGDLAMYDSGNVGSRFLAEGEADVSFGRGVETDGSNGDYHCKLFVGGKLAGVSIRNKAKSDLTDAFVGPTEFPLLTSGQIWVEVDSDVVPGDPVYVRHSGEVEIFTVTFDVDFVASNVINGTVNSVAIAPVTFSVDHTTTITALAAAIQALANVATATVTGAREITVTGATDAEDLTSAGTNFTVTLGGAQAVDTVASVSGPSTSDILGVFRADDDDVGTTANATLVTRAKFLTSANEGGVALLDINLP